MTILGIQRRLRELGRIRTGDQVPTNNGRSRPNKLDHFRLTSSSRDLMEAVAGLYGGECQEWESPAGTQWQVYVKADVLDIEIPPANAFSQKYEVWQAGGCKRRCDGQYDEINDRPCSCDPDNRDCKPTTRLNVMLSRLPGLGVWRLESKGYHAAAELGGLADMLAQASAQGTYIPAVLRLEQREVKRPGPDGKPQTRKFAVPVIDITVPLRDMLSMLGGSQPMRPALAAKPEHPPAPAIEAPKAFTNFPDQQPTWPAPPIPPSPNQRGEVDAAPIASPASRQIVANSPDWPAPDDAPERRPITDIQRFAMQCRDAGFVDDDQRHDFIELVTEGRTRSSKDMTVEEIAAARQRLTEGVKTSTLALVPGDTDKAKVAAIYNLCPELPRKGAWNLDQWLPAYKAAQAAYPEQEGGQHTLEGKVVDAQPVDAVRESNGEPAQH